MLKVAFRPGHGGGVELLLPKRPRSGRIWTAHSPLKGLSGDEARSPAAEDVAAALGDTEGAPVAAGPPLTAVDPGAQCAPLQPVRSGFAQGADRGRHLVVGVLVGHRSLRALQDR